MFVPSFVIPFEFHEEIDSVEETDTGFSIKYNDHQDIEVQCDVLTAAYYGTKLRYELRYNKSVNREILDDLISNISAHSKEHVYGFSCTYDNCDKFVITVGGISIKCDDVNRDLKDDISALVQYLSMLYILKNVQNFIDRCLEIPDLIEDYDGTYYISYGDQKLTGLTKDSSLAIMAIIKHNIPINRSEKLYRNIFPGIVVCSICLSSLIFWYLYSW
jgi:hypothetical protein